jgi:hypothetical protein
VATLRGSCLCGGVRFEVAQPFESVGMCHCTSCKKISGGVGTASARVPVEAIRIVAGEELVRRYQPSEGLAKSFCSACGSNLFGGGWPERPKASVRLSAIDDPFDDRPTSHIFVRSVAPWETLPDDGLQRFEKLAPQ